MDEAGFIARLRALANDPGARGLADDAAVLDGLVLTHDMLVEGVHYLPGDPAGDVAWKLVATNLSDLAAKGAAPAGVLLGYMLGDAAWDAAFLTGLADALRIMDVPLLGGDTVSSGGGRRALGLTAIGRAPAGGAPARKGARPGDLLWVSGTIGDAGIGLRIAKGEMDGPAALLDRYRRPRPRLALGQAIAARVHAMMDVSDGLLIDAGRMAAASGLALTIDLDAVPLSADLRACTGEDRPARLAAVTAGDDYELLFAVAPDEAEAMLTLRQSCSPTVTLIGRFTAGAGITLHDRGGAVPLPSRLGYEHGAGHKPPGPETA